MYNLNRAGAPERMERFNAMFKMYCEGKTYEQVGQHYGITRERVRQVLFRGADPEQAAILQELTQKRRLQASQQADKILSLLAEGQSRKQVAEALGVSIHAVKRVVSKTSQAQLSC